jgi:parallel beta-helix repeat protein
MVVLNGADNASVEGLVIDQNQVDQATGIYVADSSGVDISRNRFLSPKSGAVYILGGNSDMTIQGNKFLGAGYAVIVADPANTRGLVIDGNVFNGRGALGDAIEINVPSKGGVSDLVISSNVITGYAKSASNANTGFGIGVAGVKNVSITGNMVSLCGRNGIHVEDASGAVTVTGNTVRDSGDAGIEVQPTPAGIGTVLISSHTVHDCCTDPTTNVPNLAKGGIQVGWENAGVATTLDVVVSANIVSGNRFAGIYCYQAPGVQIVGNRSFNNGTFGIELKTAPGAIISANRCYDSRTTRVQAYGLRIATGGASTLLVIGNNFEGNLNADGVSDLTEGAVYAMNVAALGKEAVSITGGTRRLGFYGTAAIAKPTATPAAATDAATTQALVNDLRAKLVALGLVG